MSDLQTLLADGKRFDLEQAIYIVIECCKLDPEGVVSPTRIHISDEGRVSLGEDANAASYRSPEAASGLTDDASTVYSIGVVLWELLANRRLFTGESREARIPPLPEAPAALEAIVQTALAKDPEQRYESAKALAAALAGYFLTMN